ncbi:MAG TPA: septum site-determining protein MinC [Anaerolineales bacterium]|nr:septum site-determining protein MinC [Anaerolineales bacterium]HRQ91381.1 septum site-determining protein MinC [Anaerolineales bacterium]
MSDVQAIQVDIKGIREGLLVTLSEGEWPQLEQALLDELQRRGDFLKGAKLIINVDAQDLNVAAMSRLRDQVTDSGLLLWGVLSSSAQTERSAQLMGLATRIHDGSREPEAEEAEEYYEDSAPQELGPDGGIMVRRTLRSGASVHSPGHVTIIGDVNPGAEVIAGGNVVVWGRLRGLVHAGANGNEDAIVCAMDLAPTQLRIAGHIAIPPSERGHISPEIARIQDGQVIAENWTLG